MKEHMNQDELSAVYYTHNTFAQGGRKIHVLNHRTGRCLCGYNIGICFETDLRHFKGSIETYISQPDPDHNICLRCKEILNKRLVPNK